MVVSNA